MPTVDKKHTADVFKHASQDSDFLNIISRENVNRVPQLNLCSILNMYLHTVPASPDLNPEGTGEVPARNPFNRSSQG